MSPLIARGSIVVFLLGLMAVTESYKVLVVFPLPHRSHGILGEGYVRELLRKGHEVTHITPFPLHAHDNLTTIDVSSLLQSLQGDVSIASVLSGQLQNVHPTVMLETCQGTARTMLGHDNVRTLINDPDARFDVVVAEWVWTELYAGFSALFQCPLVWSSSMDVHALILRIVDDVPNPGYTADILGLHAPPFNFFQRAKELWNMIKMLHFTNAFLPRAAADYLDVFGAPAKLRGVTLPSYDDLIYNGSFILANTHPSLGDVPRLPQNVKSIGGYHVDSVIKPLPGNLQKIMDTAEHGVIYFSLGSIMKTEEMPEEIITGLLKTFGALKETVLWKFAKNLTEIPENVHILNWALQSSILAHPNMKLFITHGGLLSTIETIHHGVPTIGIPLFADQFQNVERAVKKGYAVGVEFTLNLGDDLKVAIGEALGNPSYAARAKHLSSLYHDRPLAPADELVYWVEHAARTRGAVHLRSPALLLPWYSRLYVDLLAVLLAALLVVVLLLKSLVSLWRSIQVDVKKKSV